MQLLLVVFSPAKPSKRVQQHILGIIGIQPKHVGSKRGLWCQWKRLPMGCYKLNIDGLAREGIITGSGIIRNAMGN